MDQGHTDADALRRSLGGPDRRSVVRAFRGRGKYGVQDDTALPWLLGIASNLVGDHLRAERRRLTTLAQLAGQIPISEERRDAHELSAGMESSRARCCRGSTS